MISNERAPKSPDQLLPFILPKGMTSFLESLLMKCEDDIENIKMVYRFAGGPESAAGITPQALEHCGNLMALAKARRKIIREVLTKGMASPTALRTSLRHVVREDIFTEAYLEISNYCQKKDASLEDYS